MKTLTLIMVLLLADGQLAEQPVSIAECELVTDALSRGEVVKIDADDGKTYEVTSAECTWRVDDRYDGPCEDGA